MFSFKPRPPRTIGDAIAQSKRLVFNCDACKTITYEKPENLHFLPNVEIEFIERVYCCPVCGHSNGESGDKISVTVEA